jgi:hypothetical protein
MNIMPSKFCLHLPIFSMAQQPLWGQEILVIEASLSHSHMPHSVRLLWPSDQPLADNTQH